MAERVSTIHLARGDLAFTLVRSDRRTLGITVTAEGEVIVRAPRRVAQARVLAFVDTRGDWIAKARARFAALPLRTSPPTFVEGETHLHLGQPYALAVETGLRLGVRLEGERIVLALHRPSDLARRAALMRAWRFAEARALYPARVAAQFAGFAARGFTLPPVTIRALQRRWGSMSRDGRMTLGLDLIRAPLACLDFVVAHELCHLVHFNHGPEFRALMDETMPDHAQRRAMLEAALR